MKFVSVVVILFAAMVILPESSSAWMVRCSTFDSYKRDVSNAFRYRDIKINSINSYASAIANKACATYNKVKHFDATTKKMESYMKSQGYVNSRLNSQMNDLKSKNSALRKEMEALQSRINSINGKNGEQDKHLSSMRSVNSKQDSRLGSVESVNGAQARDLSSLRDTNAAQDKSISDLQSVNSRQDSAISDLRNKDAAQDRVIAAINAKNAAQDKDIADVKMVNEGQDSKIKAAMAVNKAQDAKINDMFNHLKNIADVTTKLVKELLHDFSKKVNKCVFANDMFMCMLTPPARAAYTYTRASTINAEQVLRDAA